MRRVIAGMILSVIAARGADREFEAASIRRNVSGSDQVQMGRAEAGRFTATNVSLRMLVMRAYKVKNFEVSGGPGWIDSERYDITATAAAGIHDEAEFKPMLQALLASRFGLRVHRETKAIPGYALVTAKNGTALPNPVGECMRMDAPPPATPLIPCGGFFMNDGLLEGRRISMTQLASALSDLLGRPVFDKTGYAGAFDLHLEFTFEGIAGFNGGGFTAPSLPAEAGNTDAKPTIFTAIQKMGLRLESRRGPAEILVIDQAERSSEN